MLNMYSLQQKTIFRGGYFGFSLAKIVIKSMKTQHDAIFEKFFLAPNFSFQTLNSKFPGVTIYVSTDPSLKWYG